MNFYSERLDSQYFQHGKEEPELAERYNQDQEGKLPVVVEAGKLPVEAGKLVGRIVPQGKVADLGTQEGQT